MSDRERNRRLTGPFPRLVEAGFGDELPDQERWDALRQHNDLILNAAGEGIYGLDLHGRTTFANPAAAAMTGHTVEELLGHSMHELVHHSHECGDKYEHTECPIYAAFQDGCVRNVCDEVFWRKNGTCFPVEYTSTPIYNSGRIVGAVVVFRDISIRKETESRLRAALDEVRTLKEKLQTENRVLRQRIESAAFPGLIGPSAKMRKILGLLLRAAATDSTVLIQGPTGTGKELLARAVHTKSERRGGPLVRINCGAISSQLVESELFGHERGAFTGADKRRIGRFEQAHGGTLFLDEVGELPLDTQVKLLRALQEREIERVGGGETIPVDVRVVAATNRNLLDLVGSGRFRADLYYRLNVVLIEVPPLRERATDLPLLVEHFLGELELRWRRPLGRPRAQALEELLSYSWPGNIRELQNVLERAALEHDSGPIRSYRPYLALEPDRSNSEADTSVARPSPSPSLSSAGGQTLDDVERTHIVRTLEACRFRVSGPHGAAQKLGMHPNTLRYRMQKLGITR